MLRRSFVSLVMLFVIHRTVLAVAPAPSKA